MARSSYIYVLFNEWTDKIIGTFTVKHEMLTHKKTLTVPVYAMRYRDGQPDEPVSEVNINGH